MRLIALALFLIACFASPGCDRSLTFDAQGNAHGTGERTYAYRTGAVQLREQYVNGKLTRSRWFKPDGAMIQETHWIDGTGEGIYLREDGSIRERIPYINGRAEGEGKEYDEAGNVTTVQYRQGSKIPHIAS